MLHLPFSGGGSVTCGSVYFSMQHYYYLGSTGVKSLPRVVQILEIFFKYFARVCACVCACDRPVGKALSIIILRLF